MDQVQVVQDWTRLASSQRVSEGWFTGNTGKELSSKTLDLTAWERYKAISLEKIEDTLTQQVGDNADVISEVERVSQMYTLVPVFLVIEGEGR